MLEFEVAFRRNRAFTIEAAARLEGAAGIVGPSGAGKSTLLGLLAGIVRPQKGRIVLDGRVLFDSAARIALPPQRRRIAVAFQEPRLFPHLNVRRNLEYGWRLTPARARRVPWSAVIEALEIGPLLGRRSWQLSGGECQRVSLARALVASPQLLLMDESLSAVDRRLRDDILLFLWQAQAAYDLRLLMVSHQLHEIQQVTDRLALVENGRTVGHGTIATLLETPALLAALHRAGLVNCITSRVIEHSPEDGITLLRPVPTDARDACADGLAGPIIKSPLVKRLPTGALVQALLRPEDIVLALAPVEHCSMQNQFAGRVAQVVRGESFALCVVEAGRRWLVEVTHQAVRELQLAAGRSVWCLFKAQAVRHGGAATAARPVSGPSLLARSDRAASDHDEAAPLPPRR